MLSPFDPIFRNVEGFPTVFREQYLWSINSDYMPVFEGRLNVWNRSIWLTPFLSMLAWFDIFFPETGHRVPSILTISGGVHGRSFPVHQWNRTFQFKKARAFNSKMIYDPALARVVEVMGPGGLIQIAWDMEFCPPDTIKVVTQRCYTNFGNRPIRWPRGTYPVVTAVEKAVSETSIELDLRVSFGVIGEIFGYQGSSTLRKLEKNGSTRL